MELKLIKRTPDAKQAYFDGFNAGVEASAQQVSCGCQNGCAFPENCSKDDERAIRSLLQK